jgi:hypothetical protein
MAIQQKILLDVGCRDHCQAGFVGMDAEFFKGIKIIHNPEHFPWPLENGSCSVVAMSHSLEKIKPWLIISLLDEIWRILENDGLFIAVMAYAGSFNFYANPLNCNAWNEATVNYFLQEKQEYLMYKPKPWKAERIFFNPYGDLEIAIRKITN